MDESCRAKNASDWRKGSGGGELKKKREGGERDDVKTETQSG